MFVTLTIAGSDSLGGAGIEADIKAMASQGAHPAVAITAVTSQNSQRVADIFPMPPEIILSQINAVLEDADVKAAKIGMLYSPDIASCVSERLSNEKFPIVADPVLVAGVGDSLQGSNLADAIADKIVPIATIITPNIPEAEELTGLPIKTQDDVADACRCLHDMGAKAVLIKGGHLPGPVCTDTLYFKGHFLQTSTPRVEIRGHGGGCILSSLIAVNLAKNMPVWQAYLRAKSVLDEAIRCNYPVGKGVPAISPLVNICRDAASPHMMPKN